MYGNNYHYWQLRQKHVLLIFNKADQYHPVISTHLEKPNNLENVSVRWTTQISFFCFFVNYGGYSDKWCSTMYPSLSACSLKKISRTLSFFLPGYEKFTEALSLNILTDHYSPQAWIHSYCWTLTAPSFCTAEIVFLNYSISALVNESTKNEFHMLLLR